MSPAELSAFAERLIGEIRQSLTAFGEIDADNLAGDPALLRNVSQEGLTLAYRCNLLSGIQKILKGDTDTLTRTERGLLERNSRIKPLLPDDDGGDE
jgi:hypothetical protein